MQVCCAIKSLRARHLLWSIKPKLAEIGDGARIIIILALLEKGKGTETTTQNELENSLKTLKTHQAGCRKAHKVQGLASAR